MKRLVGATLMATVVMVGSASGTSILEIISGDDRFTTLTEGVSASGLAEVLSGPGPFTVYAPVDAAFDALQEGLVETLLMPENKVQLTDILLYHVDNRELTAEKIPAGSNLFKPMLTEKRICITKAGGGLSIADSTAEMAQVSGQGIEASNGVIHVIDKVLIPGMRPACG